MNGWELPRAAVLGGVKYDINGDYRDILEIFTYLEDPELPVFFRWQIALALFYQKPIPPEHQQQAMDYLAEFITGGRAEKATSGGRLLDWQQDAPLIVADINRVAGREIRALPFVHWWTFLAWFHAVGEGQLSGVVAIRDKLRRGKPLEPWEKTFYREHRQIVELPKRRTREEQEQIRSLERLLDGKGGEKE